jgi:tRNA A-37 threonylcarbamoyl transferase component Bud32
VQQQEANLIGGRYRILRKIGEGGMGEVYLAEHIYIEKRVAIKLLRADVLSNQEAVIRFRQEARSASSIGHDNIIQIDDFGTLPDGRIYMAMEFLEGMALNDILAQGPLPMPRALDIIIQVGRGLAAAHAKGITHRDMKPENIFVTQKEGRDIPKLLDFGIAKVSGGDTGQNLTVAGAIFGTPFYMAPEQAMGAKMDHRVDVYAMGVILYEIFTGTVPFKADNFMGILTQHITSEAVPPSQMAHSNGRIIPPPLEAIIQKAMRKNPAERYQSMNELVQALADFGGFAMQRGSSYHHQVVRPTGPVAGRRRGWVLPAAIAGVALLAGGGIVIASLGGDDKKAVTPPPPIKDETPDAAPRVIAKAAIDAAPAAEPDPPWLVRAGADAAPAAPPPEPPPPGPADAGTAAPPPQPTRMVDVWIRSKPAGAAVMLGRRKIGVTPLKVQVPEGETRAYSVSRPGYTTATVRAGSRPEVMVELESELKGLPE